jgi:hypothetical protein
VTPYNTLLKIPSPVIPPPVEMERCDEKAVHDGVDDDVYVNPYRMFPAAAKILAPDDVATPATAEMASVEDVEQGMGVFVESTFGTTLTVPLLPLLVPTMRPGTDEDETKVFNAVTPLVPAAVEDDPVQRVRLLLLVMAKQSAGLLLDMMIDPA